MAQNFVEMPPDPSKGTFVVFVFVEQMCDAQIT